MSGDRGSFSDNSLIAAAIDSRLLSVFKAEIAHVVSYDSAKKTIVAQPIVRRPLEDSEGRVSAESQASIHNVPVGFPGAESFSTHFNLAADDVVLLVYLDFSPAVWRKTGKECDARDTKAHGPSYPIALPWFRPGAQPGPNVDESIGKPGGLRIHFHDSTIDIGADDPHGTGLTRFVAMGPDVDNALDALKAAVQTAAAGEVSAGGTGGVGLLLTALSAWPGPSVESSNLRAR